MKHDCIHVWQLLDVNMLSSSFKYYV